MRNNTLAIALIASLGLGTAVLAAPTDTKGVIKSIDAKAMTVVLADGTPARLGPDAPGCKVPARDPVASRAPFGRVPSLD